MSVTYMEYWRYLWSSFGDLQVRHSQWFMGRLPKASLVSQLVKNPPACGRPGFDPWVGKIPWRKKWLPTPVFLPGEFSPWGGKESDMTEQLSLKNLKRSSILSGSWVGFLIKIHGIDEICIPLRVGL